MKILTIISRLDMGGIEKTLLSCLPYLKQNDFEMHILCSLGGELDEEYVANGAKLIDFKGFKKPVVDSIRLKQILKKEKYDAVHSRYGHTSGLFGLICKQLNIPFYVSIHNEKAMFMLNFVNTPIISSFRKAYLNWHKNLTLKYATKIIGHSQANLSYFSNNWKENLNFDVIYNGVDFDKFSDQNLPVDKEIKLKDFVANAAKIILHIGSFKNQKNHKFLINVFKGIDPVKNNYKLILLGKGSLMTDVVEQVNESGLQNHVYFVGLETNIKPFLEIADIFLFPSLYEGFGNVLIEAQYFGIPVCVSDIAPHYEASYKDYYKYFFDPTDKTDAVNKLNLMIADLDSGKLDNINEEAHKFAKEFSVKKMSEKLAALFNQTNAY